eukprot:TRINITY_DN21675_c0_g1_i1.p1 TRINITY_DN21675_c0_g1~~TRINITY_DN21675_c0_g1_i1.p1  ORF type:complete len:294 (+),score=48.30 TRINITY_DN21675_c0_g1_i1:35-883(+)
MNFRRLTSPAVMRSLTYLGAGGIGLSGIGYLLNMSMYTVDGGERALIFDKLRDGTMPEVIRPGLHFLIPWVQKPIIYDVRITPYNIRTETGTKDLQNVSLTLRVLHRPRKKHLQTIFKDLGLDYKRKVLDSIGIEVLKHVVAQYNAGELVTSRQLVSSEIRRRLVKRANKFGIKLHDVSLTHLNFSAEFVRAIESKQVAQQYAEREKFVVEKNKQEKTAKIILAQGEAEAARMIAKAMQSGPAYITLRRIEAARDIAELLSRSRNVVYVPGSGNMLLNLPQN